MSRFSRSLYTGFAVFFITAVVLTAAEAAKPRVAVLEFKNKTEGYVWAWYRAGEAAQDMLVTELVKKGNFRVLERFIAPSARQIPLRAAARLDRGDRRNGVLGPSRV